MPIGLFIGFLMALSFVCSAVRRVDDSGPWEFSFINFPDGLCQI